MGGPAPDEFVGAFTAKLAEYDFGQYIESDHDRAKAEGFAEARGRPLSTRVIALTEEHRDPAGIALDSLLEQAREKHPLGTRIRVSVEIVHREPGERGGPEDL